MSNTQFQLENGMGKDKKIDDILMDDIKDGNFWEHMDMNEDKNISAPEVKERFKTEEILSEQELKINEDIQLIMTENIDDLTTLMADGKGLKLPSHFEEANKKINPKKLSARDINHKRNDNPKRCNSTENYYSNNKNNSSSIEAYNEKKNDKRKERLKSAEVNGLLEGKRNVIQRSKLNNSMENKKFNMSEYNSVPNSLNSFDKMYQRMQEGKQNHEQRMEKIRHKKEEIELMQLKNKPVINKNTDLLLKDKHNFLERQEYYKMQRNIHNERLRTQEKEKEDIIYKRNGPKKVFKKEEFKETISNIYDWDKARKKKIEELQKEKERREIEEIERLQRKPVKKLGTKSAESSINRLYTGRKNSNENIIKTSRASKAYQSNLHVSESMDRKEKFKKAEYIKKTNKIEFNPPFSNRKPKGKEKMNVSTSSVKKLNESMKTNKLKQNNKTIGRKSSMENKVKNNKNTFSSLLSPPTKKNMHYSKYNKSALDPVKRTGKAKINMKTESIQKKFESKFNNFLKDESVEKIEKEEYIQRFDKEESLINVNTEETPIKTDLNENKKINKENKKEDKIKNKEQSKKVDKKEKVQNNIRNSNKLIKPKNLNLFKKNDKPKKLTKLEKKRKFDKIPQAEKEEKTESLQMISILEDEAKSDFKGSQNLEINTKNQMTDFNHMIESPLSTEKPILSERPFITERAENYDKSDNMSNSIISSSIKGSNIGNSSNNKKKKILVSESNQKVSTFPPKLGDKRGKLKTQNVNKSVDDLKRLYHIKIKKTDNKNTKIKK